MASGYSRFSSGVCGCPLPQDPTLEVHPLDGKILLVVRRPWASVSLQHLEKWLKGWGFECVTVLGRV